ncbi:MAG: hypothetical protein GOVbin3264_36 [Prokaryotic dsDNA virus sp.]|nr:MAG: hypothetical protein GOVbin3264_36 [Prokaryotic dsDNA virus sp.]
MKNIDLTDLKEVEIISDITTDICKLPKGSLQWKSVGSRKLQYTVPRSVVSNIARIHCDIHWEVIAKGLNRDRCSIYHYLGLHQNSYKFFSLYRETFDEVYKKYIEIKGSKKTFIDSKELLSYLKNCGVTQSKKSDLNIDIISKSLKVSIPTSYLDISDNLKTIGRNLDDYEYKVKLNFE